LAAAPTVDSQPASIGYGQAVRQQQRNQKEAKGLTDLTALAQDLHDRVVALRVQFSSFPGGAKFDLDSDNTQILAVLDEDLRLRVKSAEPNFKALQEIAGAIGSSVADAQTAARSAHAQQAAVYAELSRQNESANEQVRARARLEEEVQKLEQLEADLLATKAEMEGLQKERLRFKGEFILAQEAISGLREEVAQELGGETGPNVRITVARNADNFGYQQKLTEGLRGARVRNHEEILAKLMTVRPEDLAQMIQSQDANSFELQMGFGPERSRRILEAFKSAIDPLSLETVSIDDRVRIELNVSTETSPYFKDAAELSRGQKCTALLPLLLARRDCPLIADQPEDNLDNHFIYETVVKAIRRMRDRRQMVLVTHNANIPVLGEADLVVVMNSDGRVGYVEKTGSVDHCQKEIIDLLEGGREAFDRRSARYGHK
jgi:ABC-type glutathione transport system ATPase component